MTTKHNAGHFTIRRFGDHSILYLALQGTKTLTLRDDVTRAQVRAALGHLPSGSHDRWRKARARVAAAGLTEQY